MKLQEPPGPDYRSAAALMDDAGQALVNLHVNLSPVLKSGNFRLPTNADADRIQLATQMQTDDGKQFQIVDLKLSPGYHTIGPDRPLYEFHYQPK